MFKQDEIFSTVKSLLYKLLLHKYLQEQLMVLLLMTELLKENPQNPEVVLFLRSFPVFNELS